MKKIFLICFVQLLIVFLLSCGGSISGVTDTESGGVTAVILTVDSTPAANVTVRLRSMDFVSQLPDSFSSRSAIKHADFSTDSDGKFEVSGIAPGDYSIEITDDTSSASLLYCSIKGSDTVHLDTVQLEPFASIEGNLLLHSGTAVVQIKGLERLGDVDSRGNFAFYDLPAGEYDLCITNQNGQSEKSDDIVTTSNDTASVTIVPVWRIVPDGYAEGTTGGGTVQPITVSTSDDFKSAASGDEPAVILVDGKLDVGDFSVGSNKTIVGKDTNSGLYGGRIKLEGTNYIFQNITFGPSSSDAVEITGATNVFITKCEFYDAADGLLDIVRQSDSVTISWCKFYYVDQTVDNNPSLIGHSDSELADSNKLHITMHHNWYAEGCESYMPRVRFGHVHIYNNFYNSVGNKIGIGLGVYCRVRLENSLFEEMNDAWFDNGGMASDGKIGWSGVEFENTATPDFAPNSFPVFELPYSITLDSTTDVKALVQAKAGNR